MRWCAVIFLLTWNLHWGSADEIAQSAAENTSSESWHWTRAESRHTVKDSAFPKEDHNPGPEDRERLIVAWGEVSVGSYVEVQDDDSGESRSKWVNDPWSRQRRISIRGRLLIESPDGTRRPIDWMQGVRVVVCRDSGKSPDWSHRHDQDETAVDDDIIEERGSFVAHLNPAKIRRSPGKEERFQVALSLGTKEGHAITWTNTVGVLPRSVTTLAIPGPQPISRTLQIINAAPSYRQRDFDPQKLIRAVNHLRPLGKERVIQELRQFLAVARENDNEDRIEENIDTSDRTSVFLIVRLLFEAEDPVHPAPFIRAFPFLPDPSKEDKHLWPDYPLHVQDDVPFFLLLDFGGFGGLPSRPDEQVDWAEEHGRIRPRPLHPIDNPMVAAQRLEALPQVKRLYSDQNKLFTPPFANQAATCLKGLTSQSGSTPEALEGDAWHEAASKLETRWDEELQEYRPLRAPDGQDGTPEAPKGTVK